jgi:hypothetical protein
MPTTFDGPARAIKPPGPDPPAEAAPPPGAGWLARTCCRVAGHAGDWTYPDERCVRVRMCQRCGDVTSKQEHEWSLVIPENEALTCGYDGALGGTRTPTFRSVDTCQPFRNVRIGPCAGMIAVRLSILVRLASRVVRPNGSQHGSQ